MPHRKLVIVCLTLALLAFGAFVVASSLTGAGSEPTHQMPDGSTMREDDMR